MDNIILDHPIILQPLVTTDRVQVINYLDSPSQLFVNAYLNMTPTNTIQPITQTIVLWEGAEYIAIGNWTTQDAEARIQEILSTQP